MEDLRKEEEDEEGRREGLKWRGDPEGRRGESEDSQDLEAIRSGRAIDGKGGWALPRRKECAS